MSFFKPVKEDFAIFVENPESLYSNFPGEDMISALFLINGGTMIDPRLILPERMRKITGSFAFI